MSSTNDVDPQQIASATLDLMIGMAIHPGASRTIAIQAMSLMEGWQITEAIEAFGRTGRTLRGRTVEVPECFRAPSTEGNDG